MLTKKFYLNETVLFYSLKVGKIYNIYNTAMEITAQKALYASLDSSNTYIGVLKPNESFVVIEVDKHRTYNWAKILTANGVVGWCSWDSDMRCVEETE